MLTGLLLVTPYYNKCSPKGLVRHYMTVADSVQIPAIVYNVPSRTGVSMGVDIYRQLSEHPLINGVKEASGNTELVLRTMAACGDDFNIWSGNDTQIVPLMAMGCKGVISVLANICPSATGRAGRVPACRATIRRPPPCRSGIWSSLTLCSAR